MRTTSPCLSCSKHGEDIYCHGKCEKYTAFKVAHDTAHAKSNEEDARTKDCIFGLLGGSSNKSIYSPYRART